MLPMCKDDPTMKYLTQDQYDRFQEEGILVINDFLTPSELSGAIEGIERECLARKEMTTDAEGFQYERQGEASGDPEAKIKAGGMLRKITGAMRIPELKEIFTSAKMVHCIEDLMDSDVYYHSSKVMFKPAFGGAAKPWHQDAAYWRQFEPRQITTWIALDDSTEENGCIWAIPGSHKLGLIPHVGRELQIEESRIDLKRAVPIPVKPGGLLLFHSLALHMSKKNLSDKRRCAIICDYDSLPNPMLDSYVADFADKNGVWKLSAA